LIARARKENRPVYIRGPEGIIIGLTEQIG